MFAPARDRIGILRAAPAPAEVGGGRVSATAGRILLGCLAVAATFMFAAAPASATLAHPYLRQINSAPGTAPVPGPFGPPAGITLEGSGNLWVFANGAIDKFDSAGNFLGQNPGSAQTWHRGGAGGQLRSLAFSTASTHLYAADSNFADLWVLNADTSFNTDITRFQTGCCAIYTAADNSGAATDGDVYVSSTGGSVTRIDGAGNLVNFSASGTKPYISGSQLTGTPGGSFGRPENITVDSAGNIYVADTVKEEVDEFEPSGVFVRSFTGLSSITAVAVDPTSGDVLIAAAGTVHEFSSTGAFINDLTAGLESPADLTATRPSLAVDSSGRVYVAQKNAVDVYGPAVILPTVATGEAEEITRTTAKINGTINPENTAASYQFEYGTTKSYGNTIPASPASAGSDNTVHSETAALSGLQAETTYHYRIKGINPQGTNLGPDKTFTTPPAVSGVVTEPATAIKKGAATLNGTLTPEGTELSECFFEYGDSETYGHTAPCAETPAEIGSGGAPVAVHADVEGLSTAIHHFRLVAANSFGTTKGADQSFETPPAVTALTTTPASEITNTSATLNGSFEVESGVETHYYFEYAAGPQLSHKSTVGLVPGTATGIQNLSAPIENLAPGTTYQYRIAAENKYGTTVASNVETFTTDQPPTLNAFSTSNVTATSADLHAQIDPHGFATTYRFEYGTTSAYGQSAPIPDGEIAEELGLAHSLEVHLSGLQGVQYHFRVVAENQWGTVTSEDQTFEFFPPGCPNSAVRQQTGSAYLPDCRAYELVSPGNANGTLLYAGGPNTGTATAPSRFSFTGNANSLKGTNTIETAADLYTATRTDSGWESKYIGLPGDEAGCMGGPPNSPTSHVAFSNPPYLTNTVLTDPSMSRLLIWPDGTPMNCFAGRSPYFDNNWELAPASNAPYMFNASGSINQRLPSSFAGGEEAVEALECPYPNASYAVPFCTGDVTASANLEHFVFSSTKTSFVEGGLEEAPGSAYDNDIATHSISLISLDSDGHSIAQDPSFANVPPECDSISCQTNAKGEISSVIAARGGKEEFIRFPAISDDGSHILMSTATTRTRDCVRGGGNAEPCQRFTDPPIHLYMRVNDAISYEPSRGEDGVNHAVKFLGMTPDGSKVFFTSEEQLIAEDMDTSTDLYMWSESSDSLTLISKANDSGNAGEPGQSDGCDANASWTTKCGIKPYSNYEWSLLPGGEGGNGVADSSIAANGDIYFYSPEQLDGDRGVVGGQNLYVYRGGKAQFVATLESEEKCRLKGPRLCAEGPIVRFEVTPSDSHAAFLTTTQLTSYDNAGHIEMYSFAPSSGEIICDSCRPDGEAPTDDVVASQDGRFITNDGRVFFSTGDPLVAQDTNEAIDVYEYVDGRPQLITPGTGTATAGSGEHNVSGDAEHAGLVGVSNDGTDVYFDTFDTLTSEDHNGNFLKFYDARVNGGFAQPTPVPPCKAAEECHGAGGSAPALPTQGTAAAISGGNAKQKTAAKHKHKAKKHKKAAKRHRARAANSKWRAGK